MSGTSEVSGGTTEESRTMSQQRIFRFSRRYLLPRLRETLLHKNAILSVVFAAALTFVTLGLGWIPALQEVAVKDLVAGLLAFSALGFGAATAATVLALGIPRGQLYYTMIVNGTGAPRARVVKTDTSWQAEAVDPDEEPLLDSRSYGQRFRSYYGDLLFTFVWTLGSQLGLGVISLVYFAMAGDLDMVDASHGLRSGSGLFIMASATAYAIFQMGSLLRAMADYALNQELYDRREIGL